MTQWRITTKSKQTLPVEILACATHRTIKSFRFWYYYYYLRSAQANQIGFIKLSITDGRKFENEPNWQNEQTNRFDDRQSAVRWAFQSTQNLAERNSDYILFILALTNSIEHWIPPAHSPVPNQMNSFWMLSPIEIGDNNNLMSSHFYTGCAFVSHWKHVSNVGLRLEHYKW